jgi:4'-phosphopantetheinyl transferase
MSVPASLLESGTTDAPRASLDHVDVWMIRLTSDLDPAAFETLSEAERSHAGCLRVDPGRWVAARAALRGVLGGYLGIEGRRVRLEHGRNGKPRLAPGAATDLRFNLSHSGEIALVAVRLGHEVGADVEQLRDGVDGEAIARHVFSPGERAAGVARAGDKSARGFFQEWVRREALGKASGHGILGEAAGELARFTVRDLEVVPGYAAALASEGDAWTVRRQGVWAALPALPAPAPCPPPG